MEGQFYDWKISLPQLLGKFIELIRNPLFIPKFIKLKSLSLLDGKNVSAKKMLSDLLFYLKRYHHVLDFRNDYELISAFKHRWLQFSTLDRVKTLRKSGIPIVICAQVFPEIIYGCGGSTLGSLTPYFLECHLAGKYSYQKKGHEFCSFESCPGEPVIPILVFEKILQADLFLMCTHTFMGDVPCIYNLMRRYNIPLYYIDFPSGPYNKKPWLLEYLANELRKAVKNIEELFGKKITKDDIVKGIKMINNVRRTYIEYNNIILSAKVPPISSFENSIIQSCIVDMQGDPVALTQAMKDLNNELKERVRNNKKAIGVSDDPIRIYAAEKSGFDLASLNLIDDLGAILIGPEVCEIMYLCGLIDEHKDPFEAIAEYYIKWIWAPTVPLKDRAKWFMNRVKQVNADGVIFTGVWGCQWDPAYRKYLSDLLQKELNIPSLFLEFEDIQYEFTNNGRYKIKEQNRTRIEAFIEIIRKKKFNNFINS